MSNDLVSTYYAPPYDYPVRSEMENPHPALNVRLGQYNTLTGVKTGDSVPGVSVSTTGSYSGTGALAFSSVGQGFSFDVVRGFSVYVYHTTTARALKWWINSDYQGEVSYSNPTPGYYELLVTSDINRLKTITVVATGTGDLVVDYIQIRDTAEIASAGARTYPKITLKSRDTVGYYSALGRDETNTDHPVTFYSANRLNPLGGDPSTNKGAPATNATYDKVRFLDGVAFLGFTDTLDNYRIQMIEVDLLAVESPYNNLTSSELQGNVKELAMTGYALGSGAVFGLLVYGLNLYCYNNDTLAWDLQDSNAVNFPGEISSTITSQISDYIDNEGKVYYLLVSANPSDGVINASVEVDYFSLSTTLNYAKLGADLAVNRADNLLDNGWAEYSASSGYGQLTALDQDILDTRVGNNLTHENQLVTLSYEVWRDTAAYDNGVFPGVYAFHYDHDGVYLGLKGSLDEADKPAPNQWKRITKTFNLLSNVQGVRNITVRFYRSPDQELEGTVKVRNVVLVPGDSVSKILPQTKSTIGFAPEITIADTDVLTLDGTGLYATKNVTPVTLADDSQMVLPQSSFNYLQWGHLGGNLEVVITDEEKSKIGAFGTVYVPYLKGAERSVIFLGDRGRTPFGGMRQDFVASKDKYEVTTAPMTREESKEFLDYLHNTAYRSGMWWLEEFGSAVNNSTRAYIIAESLRVEPIEFSKDGVWHNDGRTLSFTVEEA